MDLQKYRALFIEESREHIAEVSRLLVALETATDQASLIDDIFRHVHSVKGMAASMEYGAIAAVAHGMEDVVATHRKEHKAFAPQTMDLLFKGIDLLGAQVEQVADEIPPKDDQQLVQALKSMANQLAASISTPSAAKPVEAAPLAPSAPASPPPSGKRVVHIHVEIDQAASAPSVRAFLVHRRLCELGEVLDMQPTLQDIKEGRMQGLAVRLSLATERPDSDVLGVLALVPELSVANVSADATSMVSPPATGGLPAAGPSPGESAAAKPASDSVGQEVSKGVSTVRVRTDILDGLIDAVGELFIARERIVNLLGERPPPELRAAVDALSTRIRDIHEQVMAVRMMPMRTLLERFPRLVRDLSRSLGKDVELELDGGEIELDRAILDHLDAPFIHTLRNAVDHGIESQKERLALGKPAAGKISISASRDRDTVVVVIADDGRGLDSEVLRQAAVEKGLFTADQAQAMSTREAYFLICLPGFSTKAEVSDVSGRGVGMDAVRSKIESLGGTIDIESHVGAGTRFIFRLPLTLAIIPVLLVQAADRIFAIPVAKVVGVREEHGEYIQQAGGGRYLSFQHALVPVRALANVLELPTSVLAAQLVVIEDGRDLYAIAVERIVGYHEVVVKPLGDPLDRLEWFSGATLLGDGQPILILDLPKAFRARAAA